MPGKAQDIIFAPGADKTFWSQPIDKQIQALSALNPEKTKGVTREAWQQYIAEKKPQAEQLFRNTGSEKPATSTAPPKTAPPVTIAPRPSTEQKAEVKNKPAPTSATPPQTAKPTAAPVAAKPAAAKPSGPSWWDKVLDEAGKIVDYDKKYYEAIITPTPQNIKKFTSEKYPIPGINIDEIGTGIGRVAREFGDESKKAGKEVSRIASGVEREAGKALDYASTKHGQQAIVDTAKAALSRLGDVADSAFTVQGGAAMAVLTVAPEFGPIGIAASKLLGTGISVSMAAQAVKSLFAAADNPTPQNVGNAIADVAVAGPILSSVKKVGKEGAEGQPGILEYLKGKLTGKGGPQVEKLKSAVSEAVGSRGNPDSRWFEETPVKEDTAKVGGTPSIWKNAKEAVGAGTPKAIIDYALGEGHTQGEPPNTAPPEKTLVEQEAERRSTFEGAPPNTAPEKPAAKTPEQELEEARAENARLKAKGQPPKTAPPKKTATKTKTPEEIRDEKIAASSMPPAPIKEIKPPKAPDTRAGNFQKPTEERQKLEDDLIKAREENKKLKSGSPEKTLAEQESERRATFEGKPPTPEAESIPPHAATRDTVARILAKNKVDGTTVVRFSNSAGKTTEIPAADLENPEAIDRAARDLGESTGMLNAEIVNPHSEKPTRVSSAVIANQGGGTTQFDTAGLPVKGSTGKAKISRRGVEPGDTITYLGTDGAAHLVGIKGGETLRLQADSVKKLFGEPETKAETTVTPELETAKTPDLAAKLPAPLAKANPRYRYGEKAFTVKFANDLDRAAYITAQPEPSKADAKYLKFVMDATGLTEEQVRDYGREVRAEIKAKARKSEPGEIEIENIAETLLKSLKK